MKAVLGTMTFGGQVTGQACLDLVDEFRVHGGTELDAAYIYTGGACEKEVGACVKARPEAGFAVATKASPAIFGSLNYEAVCNQLNESLARLDAPSVQVFYLHAPDPATPLEETLRACADLYAQGKFAELGLSNYNTETIARIMELCPELGCPLPTVYEGLYNGLCRTVEDDLMAALSQYGMRFYVYNPLAGGLLTGRYSGDPEELKEGRFAAIPSYQQYYWKESNFKALACAKQAADAEGIPLAQAAYRWLSHHSQLQADRGDAVIIGSSKLAQLQQNLASLQAGPLPESVVAAFEEAWEIARPGAVNHYRPFSK